MKRLKAWWRRCQRGWRGRCLIDDQGVIHMTMVARIAHWPVQNWSAYDAPPKLRQPANVARLRIERARKIPDMKVPSILTKQAE